MLHIRKQHSPQTTHTHSHTYRIYLVLSTPPSPQSRAQPIKRAYAVSANFNTQNKVKPKPVPDTYNKPSYIIAESIFRTLRTIVFVSLTIQRHSHTRGLRSSGHSYIVRVWTMSTESAHDADYNIKLATSMLLTCIWEVHTHVVPPAYDWRCVFVLLFQYEVHRLHNTICGVCLAECNK